jgi:hypothetical protein
MTREEMIAVVSPCGLDCARCIALVGGGAQKHAIALQETLGPSFERWADRFAEYAPALKKYRDFREVLDLFAGVDCIGCRDRKPEGTRCSIIRCFRDKGVDFCFECGEFPCDPEGIDGDLKERWIETGKRIREIGLEAWYEDMRKRHRYE